MASIVRFDVAGVHHEQLSATPALPPPRLRRQVGRAEHRRGRTLVVGLARDLFYFVKLLYRLARDPRVSRLDRLLLLSATAYLIAPNDLIPDRIPVLGQLDDLLVVTLALRQLFRHAGIEVLLEHWDGDPATLEALLEVVDRGATLLTDGDHRRALR